MFLTYNITFLLVSKNMLWIHVTVQLLYDREQFMAANVTCSGTVVTTVKSKERLELLGRSGLCTHTCTDRALQRRQHVIQLSTVVQRNKSRTIVAPANVVPTDENRGH